MSQPTRQYWEEKSLKEMTRKEWEDLCDGCGKCCLNKIEDEDTGDIFFTNVGCKLFESRTCKCSNYNNRKKLVADCQILTPKKVNSLTWLPSSCSYRRVNEGKGLPDWHHLVSGSKSTIHRAGASLKGKIVLNEQNVKDLEDHVVDWLD